MSQSKQHYQELDQKINYHAESCSKKTSLHPSPIAFFFFIFFSIEVPDLGTFKTCCIRGHGANDPESCLQFINLSM